MTNALECVEYFFKCLEGRDQDAIFSCFANDAVFIDPHYPYVEMRGHQNITKGLRWGLKSIDQFGFTVVNSFSSCDGRSTAVEVDTHHVLQGGKEIEFPQAFFAEVENGKLTRLQAYEPYRPNGAMGIFLRISHFKARILW